MTNQGRIARRIRRRGNALVLGWVVALVGLGVGLALLAPGNAPAEDPGSVQLALPVTPNARGLSPTPVLGGWPATPDGSRGLPMLRLRVEGRVAPSARRPAR